MILNTDMTHPSLYLKALWCVVSACATAVAVWLLLSYLDPDYSHLTSVSVAQSALTDEPITLPFTELFSPQNSSPLIKANFSVPAGHVVYIRHYIGIVKVFREDVRVFSTTVAEGVRFNLANPLLIDPAAFRHATTAGTPTEFQLQLYSVNNAAKMSEIYIGPEAMFYDSVLYSDLRHELRLFFVGAMVVLLCLALISFPMTMYRFVILPFLIMLVFFTILTLGKTRFFSGNFEFYYRYLIPCFPILGVAVISMMKLSVVDGESASKKVWVYSIVCSLLIYAIFLGVPSVTITQANALLSVPSFLLIMYYYLFFHMFPHIHRIDIDSCAVVSCALIICFLLTHDFLSYTAAISSHLFMGMASPFFMLLMMVLLFHHTVSLTRKRLENFNAELLSRMGTQRVALEEDHKNNSKLLAENIGLEQRQNLNLELHDGVLTYLAKINAMTEKPVSEKEIILHKLARNATREIRIILDSDPILGHSLFTALASLRVQLVEPLGQIGVRVRWRMTSLVDYASTDSGMLMDVIRIIQESTHNAVRRSGCTSLSVLALKDANQRDIIVITNRGGTPYRQQSERGHGISSMRQRAKRIGAQFYIESRPGGGRVRLIMPKSAAI